MRTFLSIWVWALLAWVVASCKPGVEGTANLNQAPVAALNVKEITLSDSTHLVSKVHLYWTASDADGFIKGFRLSVDNAAYSGVLSKTDSLFSFNLKNGTLTQNISVRVVAIDNLGSESAPAELVLPIRNSLPVVTFNNAFLPRLDTALAVLSLPFIASDPDGNNTLDSVFLRVNGGPWYGLASNTSSVFVVLSKPRELGTQPAFIYASARLNATPLLRSALLPGIQVGGPNTFEIMARDLAGAQSPIAQVLVAGTPKPFYFKVITSDFLVLDAHPGTALPTPESTYNPVLAAAYPQGYDKIDLTVAGGKNQQKQALATFPLLLNQYKKVFWYSDKSRLISFNGANISLNRIDSTLLLIESMAPIFAGYITQPDRHLLVSVDFPEGTNRLPLTSPVYGFLPVDSILYNSSRARLGRGVLINSNQTRYPTLRSLTRNQNGITLDGVESFYPNAQCDTIYTAPLTFTSPEPSGSRAVGGRFPKGAAKPSLIFFSLELDKLAGDTTRAQSKPEFTEFMRNVLTRDFE